MKFSTQSIRLILLGVIFSAGLLALASKLFLEQIRRTQSHNIRISRQSIRMIRRPALRGRIYTSDLQILADNYPVYNVYLYLAEMRQPGSMRRNLDYIELVIGKLADAIGRENDIKRDDIIRHINYEPGLPFVAFKNLDEVEIARASAIATSTDGVAITPETARIYPFDSLAAHVIGYTQLRDPAKAADRRDYFYYIPDQIGVTGLERVFDQLPSSIGLQSVRGLRGLPGYDVIRVDNRGFVDSVLPGGEPPFNGNSIITTLDFDAQNLGEGILRGHRGAFVLMDADTGAVLALASSPSLNLSDYSPVRNNPAIRASRNNPDQPELNRVLQEHYMPGSIVKPLIGLAIMQSGISPRDTIECTGRTQIGKAAIRCTGVHGEVDLELGLERSCNVYFNVRGMELGLDKMRAVMEEAGFGKPTGIELSEVRGILPGGSHWTPFNSALIAIGQGPMNVTPMQAVVYIAALANGGKIMQPRLLHEIRGKQGELLYQSRPHEVRQLSAGKEQLDIVKNGMDRVVNAPRGSGRQAHLNQLKLYGKTGSAEKDTSRGRVKNTFFVCFCYHEGRTYAALLLVEEGEFGGTTCAPLMKQFFAKWLGVN